MKESLHDIDLIERYFDNALTPEEANDVNERLKRDFEFQKLFDRERLLINTIRYEGAVKDLAYLRDLEASIAKRGSGLSRRWYYLAAACIAAVALALWFPLGDRDLQETFTAYYQPHPNIFEPVLRNEPVDSPRRRAFMAYEQEDYETAAALLAEQARAGADPGVLMLLGNANLSLGRTEAAIQNFTELIDRFDDLDAAATWYLALAYLRSGDQSQARLRLADLSSGPGPYAQQAKALLDDLE